MGRVISQVKYDLLLRGGHVVDPASGMDEVADVGIKSGSVERVEPEIDPAQAGAIWDLEGLLVMPGIVDLHVHTSRRHKGYNAHRMMARAGVVTALDMGGPWDEFLEFCRADGAGLNMACLEQVRPGLTVEDVDPSAGEIQDLLDRSLQAGAVGLKILGGHYPMSPGATRRIIEACNREKVHVAFHSGTTETPGNIDGLIESVELAGDLRLHIPHINSYCRGSTGVSLEEAYRALKALKGRDNLFTESYLATINGTSGRCIQGVPESHATRRCLEEGGYEPTQAGLERAIRESYTRVGMEYGDENINVTGEKGVQVWSLADTVVSVNFPVNSPESRFLCAVAKDEEGDFVVDAIATDGGGHPRNVAVEFGLGLVRAEGLTLSEFVQKASYTPAMILGLLNKGHLSPGADADITVADLETCRPVMAFNAGRLIMHGGAVVGSGTRIITTGRGLSSVGETGLEAYEVDSREGLFYA